jgi:D-alanyl-lipoteichoic acid acyltransferase DltB (MBOAT superfamily)
VRGTTHLLLYRLIYQLQGAFSPPQVPVPLAVTAKMALCFLLYLRVSGQFHIVVGMLHLFGYDLPETNRRYLLATSFEDMWRRINIYWKDFMVKIFYFPLYFKLRKTGDLRAKLLATAFVFIATWFLHLYQFFWLQGKLRLTANDALFWTILALLVMANTWMDSRHGKRAPETGVMGGFRNGMRMLAIFAVMSVLWSMWSADSLTEWFYFLKSGDI